MENNNHSQIKQNLWLDLFYITLFGAIYFIVFLGSRNLSIPDEGRYPEIAREMLRSGDWITPMINGVPFLDKPIMYYWLEAISLKIFGVNAWGARMPMAFFGFIGVSVAYVMGRVFYNRLTGLLTAAILASSPLYFLAAHYANLDLEVANFLWICACLMALGLRYPYPSKARQYCFYGAYIFGACAFLTKGMMGFVFPAMVMGIWIIMLNRWKVLKEIYLPTGLILFLIIICPWLILVQLNNPDFFYYFFYYQQVARFIGDDFHTSKVMGPWFYFLVMLVGMLPWCIYYLAKIPCMFQMLWKKRFEDTTALFLLIWSIAIFIFFSIPSTKLVGYILPILPTIAILMAKATSDMAEQGISKAFKITYLIGSIVLVIGGIALFVFPAAQHKIPMGMIYPVFVPVGIILIVGGIIGYFSLKNNQLIASVVVTMITMMLFNLGVVLSAPVFDTKGSEPLTNEVVPLMDKDTKIVSYENYKEDIPFLVQRKVYIVSDWSDSAILNSDNWKREFYFGIQQYQQTHQGQWPKWYINKDQFIKLWNESKSVFVFTDEHYFVELQKELKPTPYLVAHKKHYVVFAKP